MTESIDAPKDAAVPGIDFGSLLGNPASNPQPASPLENQLAQVTPQDAAASRPSEAQFSFRTLLTEQQLADLRKSAPAVAEQMAADYNTIIKFGAPVLERLTATSSQLLNAQKDIKIPQAEAIVNDLLREIDGFAKKYRNVRLENGVKKVVNFLRGIKYTLTTLARESRPIADKIDMAEVKLKEMEIKLADNVTRGQTLHKNTLTTLQEVAAVLAALEEITDCVKREFADVDALLKGVDAPDPAGAVEKVDYKGRQVTVNELQEIHSNLAGAVGELEKTWFDWRQQFFLGYAQAPSIRNLILVSATMQRRCQVFRTMGLPSARSSLAMWQQAALAQEGAAMGEAVQKGTNNLIQGAFKNSADAVEQVANASQMPIINEETVFVVIDSIKRQCEGLVAADKWGRELRARNIKALEAGEHQIEADFTESRRKLVENAIAATAESSLTQAPMPESDALKQLGVKE
jgi:uncharacterized protein YaaN involved in tellurite resistance